MSHYYLVWVFWNKNCLIGSEIFIFFRVHASLKFLWKYSENVGNWCHNQKTHYPVMFWKHSLRRFYSQSLWDLISGFCLSNYSLRTETFSLRKSRENCESCCKDCTILKASSKVCWNQVTGRKIVGEYICIQFIITYTSVGAFRKKQKKVNVIFCSSIFTVDFIIAIIC